MFLDYFMAKVAPSEDSEVKRTNVFNKLKSLIEIALGKGLSLTLIRWPRRSAGSPVRVRSFENLLA
jgi:hypothetical protein